MWVSLKKKKTIKRSCEVNVNLKFAYLVLHLSISLKNGKLYKREIIFYRNAEKISILIIYKWQWKRKKIEERNMIEIFFWKVSSLPSRPDLSARKKVYSSKFLVLLFFYTRELNLVSKCRETKKLLC